MKEQLKKAKAIIEGYDGPPAVSYTHLSRAFGAERGRSGKVAYERSIRECYLASGRYSVDRPN